MKPKLVNERQPLASVHESALPERYREEQAAGESAWTDWREYLNMIRRRWIPALAVFIVALAAGVYHGMNRVPVYEAKVRLLIDRDRTGVAGLGDQILQDLELDFQTHLTILQSRSLARRTMQALGLWSGPADQVQTNGAGSTPSPDGASASASIDGFLAPIRVSQVAGSRLVDVYYSSLDPVEAARRVNALAAQFMQQTFEDQSGATSEVTAWLMDRLNDQRTTLEASEKALQAYRERNADVATRENTNMLVQKLGDLISSYTKAKTERIEKGAIYTQAQSLARDPVALEGFPPVLANPVVQQLKSELNDRERQEKALSEKLGPRHPNLIQAREAVTASRARLHQEILRTVESLRQDYLAAQDTETSLNQALEAQKRESLALNRSDVELAVLQRDAESNRQIYNSLNQRINEFAVVRQRRGNNIRVVDPAEVPRAAMGTAMWRDIRYGALGGLALAFCVAFVLERFDSGVKTPHQIRDLGLPLLGLIPRVATPAGAPRPLVGSTTAAAFDEAFRALRTNLRLSSATDGPRTILVTSPGSGDGKSLVAANLATVLANGGHRVVLVDADLRRPSLHTAFGTNQAPGLSEVLSGQSDLQQVLQRPKNLELTLVPSGTHPPNPSELLDSERYTQLLSRLREQFEWLIIDSPPVMPVTDALILASEADDVIVVAAAESTPRPALRGALEQLRRTPARLVGAVLNRVDLERRGYYYSDYYHRNYSRYYVQSGPSGPAST